MLAAHVLDGENRVLSRSMSDVGQRWEMDRAGAMDAPGREPHHVCSERSESVMRDTDRHDASDLSAAALTRRHAIAGIGGAAVLAGFAAAFDGMSRAAAQDATPTGVALPGFPTDIPKGAVGATVEALNGGEAADAPGFSLSLLRFTFSPGSTIAPHYHAGPQAGWVASGDLAITRVGGPDCALHRAPSNGTPGPTEGLPLGTEVVLNQGDALFDPGSSHWVRNTGAAPCVIYVAVLYKDGEKGTTFIDAEGNPLS